MSHRLLQPFDPTLTQSQEDKLIFFLFKTDYCVSGITVH